MTGYVRLPGNDGIGTILDSHREVGDRHVWDVLIESTGEVRAYAKGYVTRCNEDGSPLTT